LPKFTWSPDPEAFGFVLPAPFWMVMIVAAVVAALFAFVSHRANDKGGVWFGAAAGVGALIAAAYWPTWQPWVAVRYYSLIFVLVFLGGYWLLDWQIRRGGGGREEAGDFIVYGVIGVLAGARLGHVLFYDLDKALADPMWVFEIWTGGLASHGATLGLIVAMWLFTARRRVPFLEGADRFAFSAALGATLVRAGNFLNSEIVGREIPDASWGVLFAKTCEPRPEAVGCWKFLGQHAAAFAEKCQTGPVDCWGYDETVTYRHPSQLYEVALGLFVLGALFVFDRALGKEKRPRGALISLFFALYFAGRFFVEFFKDYQTDFGKDWHVLTMGQVLSIPAFLLGVYGLFWAFRTRQPVGWVPAEGEPEDEPEDDTEDELPRRDRDVEAEFGGSRRRRSKSRGKARRDATETTDAPRPTRRRRHRDAEPAADEHDGADSAAAPTEAEEASADATPEPATRGAEAGGRGQKRRRKRRPQDAGKRPPKAPPDDDDDD
jgi:phosphatidylglycerol:prolipoprotein diacylglycerol transferase